MSDSPYPPSAVAGSAREVLWAFLRLGCISFGGPIARLGYFHAEFVERRRWCSEQSYAELVALAQSLAPLVLLVRYKLPPWVVVVTVVLISALARAL